MNQNQRAVAVLFAEYKRGVSELLNTIDLVTDLDLIAIVDRDTLNPDCVSIQTILTHVVSSGFSYANYIRKHIHVNFSIHPKSVRPTVAIYQRDLADMIAYTFETLNDIADTQLESYDNALKIETSWGQYYDIEQLLEHAIVHVLRHRRQIEKFKSLLKI